MQANSPARSGAPSSAAPAKSSPASTLPSIAPSQPATASPSAQTISNPSSEGAMSTTPAPEGAVQEPTGTPLQRTADVFLLLVYGAVIFFFLWRFFRRRRLPSLFVALMPTGWVLVALFDLRIMEPHPTAVFRWGGVVVGTLLLWSVVKSEWRQEREAAGLPVDEPRPPSKDPGGLT
jgi:hypothetical protein